MKCLSNTIPYKLKWKKYHNVHLYINRKDYPDFADSYVISADWLDGTPLSDAELDAITDDEVYEMVEKAIW